MWSVAFYSLLQLLLGPAVSCGRVRWGTSSGNMRVGGWLCGGFFSSWQQWPLDICGCTYLCALSPLWSLGSASPHTDHSDRTAHCVSFLLWAQEVPTTWFLPSPKNLSELWAASMAPVSTVLPSLLAHSYMLTFRCFNAGISQMCLCAEHGILCWIIAFQIVITLRGVTRGTSYNVIFLMSFSWHFIFVFSLFQVFSSSVFIFMPSCGLSEHFFRISFWFFYTIFRTLLCIAFFCSCW